MPRPGGRFAENFGLRGVADGKYEADEEAVALWKHESIRPGHGVGSFDFLDIGTASARFVIRGFAGAINTEDTTPWYHPRVDPDGWRLAGAGTDWEFSLFIVNQSSSASVTIDVYYFDDNNQEGAGLGGTQLNILQNHVLAAKGSISVGPFVGRAGPSLYQVALGTFLFNGMLSIYVDKVAGSGTAAAWLDIRRANEFVKYPTLSDIT